MLERVGTRLLMVAIGTGASSVAAAASHDMEVGLSVAQVSFDKTKGEPGTDASGAVASSVLFHLGSFAVGPVLDYYRHVDLGQEDSAWSAWEVGVGVRGKFYFLGTKDVAPYALAEAKIGVGADKGLYDQDSKDDIKSVAGGAGLAMFVSSDIAIDTELVYDVEHRKTDYEDAADDAVFAQEDESDRNMTTTVRTGFSVFF